MTQLAQLFPVNQHEQFPVDVKNLHMFLEVETRWNIWFRRKVEQVKSWLEGVDFIVIKNDHNEYLDLRCTLNMAKELAMLELNDKGAQARAYFIECEQRLRAQDARHLLSSPHRQAKMIAESMLDIGKLFGAPTHLVQIEAVKEVRKHTSIDLAPLLVAAPAQNEISQGDEFLEPTELGKKLKQGSGRSVNLFLESQGLQRKVNGQWEPTQAATGQYSKHSWAKGSKSGYNIKWRVIFIKGIYDHPLIKPSLAFL